MSAAGGAAPDPFEDALTAARLCAIDPGLGGMVLRGGGDLRDVVIAELRAGLPEDAPLRRVPSHIDDERLLGGIDLTATLAKGIAVSRIGLLAEADGGVVVVPTAERLSDATAGRIAAAIDAGEAVVERDGTALRSGARFVTVLLDDGVEPDERTPDALAERLAFRVDLSNGPIPAQAGAQDRVGRDWAPAIGAAGVGQRNVLAPAESIEALAATATALGIDSACRCQPTSRQPTHRPRPPKTIAAKIAARPAGSRMSSSPPRSRRCRRTSSPASPPAAAAAPRPARMAAASGASRTRAGGRWGRAPACPVAGGG